MTQKSTLTKDFTSLLYERYSCRGYLPTPVSREAMYQMFEMAQQTASWCNTQPWQVAVTSGAATRRFSEALLEHAAKNQPGPDFATPSKYVGVYNTRRKESGIALYNSLGIQRHDTDAREEQALKNLSFFGAPHVAVITTDRNQGIYGAIDCGGYVNSLMLAAQSLGIATIAQASIAMYSDAIREHFRFANDRMVVCAVAFGYEDPDHPANSFRTTRASLTYVLDEYTD